MRKKLSLASLLLALALPSFAAQVDIDSLGSLVLEFAQGRSANLYPAPPVSARAGFRGGDAFSLVSPGRVQQIDYLVAVGQQVQAGQPFAILRGPEMHHLQIEYQAAGELLEVAQDRYDSNKALFARKAIRADQWLEVSENYFAAQLEYEHLRHFYELVADNQDDPDAITLVAPSDSLLDYDNSRRTVEAGERIASFIPQGAVRVQLSLPNAMREDAAYLETGKCRLAIEQIGAITQGFFVSAWTEPLKQECELIPGQQLLATPLLRTSAYAVPRSAVFQWGEGSYVILRQGEALLPVPVMLLASQGPDYILQSETELQGRAVLVSSVSAVQGVLMGLGGE